MFKFRMNSYRLNDMFSATYPYTFQQKMAYVHTRACGNNVATKTCLLYYIAVLCAAEVGINSGFFKTL